METRTYTLTYLGDQAGLEAYVQQITGMSIADFKASAPHISTPPGKEKYNITSYSFGYWNIEGTNDERCWSTDLGLYFKPNGTLVGIKPDYDHVIWLTY